MRWKRWRILYRAEARAYARHLIEQHERHIFSSSLLDEAPGITRRTKLTFLLNEEQEVIYRRMTRSVRRRMQRVRDGEVERALKWYARHYPTSVGKESEAIYDHT